MRKAIPLIGSVLLLVYASRSEASGEASLLIGKTYVDELLLEDKASFGGTIGVFSRVVGFELGFDYMPTSDLVVPGVNLGASVLNLAGNVVVQAPIGQFQPYATAGYGALFANASGDALDGDFLGTFGAINYGLGVKLYFTDNVGIRIDYRRFAVQVDEGDPDLVIPIVDQEIEADPDIDRFLIGVSFRW